MAGWDDGSGWKTATTNSCAAASGKFIGYKYKPQRVENEDRIRMLEERAVRTDMEPINQKIESNYGWKTLWEDEVAGCLEDEKPKMRAKKMEVKLCLCSQHLR